MQLEHVPGREAGPLRRRQAGIHPLNPAVHSFYRLISVNIQACFIRRTGERGPQATMSNPLLEDHHLPPFSRIEPTHVEPAVRELISRNRQAIDELLAAQAAPDWDNILQPIEELEDSLERCWAPVSHLNGVMNSDALREAYNRCLPLLSEYSTWLGQHRGLYQAYRAIAEGPDYQALDQARRKAVDNAVRDFRLAGVSLPEAERQRYGELQQRLSELGSTFSENVLDATHAWQREATEQELSGLPPTALASARQAARDAGKDGYLVTLDMPSVLPVMSMFFICLNVFETFLLGT